MLMAVGYYIANNYTVVSIGMYLYIISEFTKCVDNKITYYLLYIHSVIIYYLII